MGAFKGAWNEILINLPEIVVVSRKFLGDLEERTDSVGQCFLDNADAMKTAYRKYLLNFERASDLLKQHKDDDELLEVAELVRAQVPCTDLPSMLIKPVQRIMKYNLFIAELVKVSLKEGSLDRVIIILLWYSIAKTMTKTGAAFFKPAIR